MSNRAGAICNGCGIKHDRPNDKGAMRNAVIGIHGSDCVYCGMQLQTIDCEADDYMELERIAPSCLYNVANILPACHRCNAIRKDGPMVKVARNLTTAIAAVERAMATDPHSINRMRTPRATVPGYASTIEDRIAYMRSVQLNELATLRAMLPV